MPKVPYIKYTKGINTLSPVLIQWKLFNKVLTFSGIAERLLDSQEEYSMEFFKYEVLYIGVYIHEEDMGRAYNT
jgi:hypothetical protein